jgi:hypothetical protein
LRTGGACCQLWDGDGFRRLRAGDGLIDLYGRRLALNLMIQPDSGLKVIGDQEMRNQGFISRFLMTAPEPLAGSRLPWDKEPARGLDAALRFYTRRILEIFELPIPAANDTGNELTPRTLVLSDEAELALRDFFIFAERGQKPGGPFAKLTDVAGKMTQQAGRLAGVLTLVDDSHAAEIDGDAMLRACELCRWYLGETIRLAADAKEAPALQDAELLKTWIADKGHKHVTSTILLNGGPNKLRDKAILDPAIDVLVANGWLIPDGASRRSWRVA